jgi:hypothetical protein
MGKITFDDFLLVSIFILNSKLFWILFSVHYKYDYRSYMEFYHFDKLDFYLFL